MSEPGGGLARAVVRLRGPIALAWLVAGATLAPAARDAERRLDVGARIPGSESAAAEAVLAERFATPFARHAVLVVAGVPAPDTEPGRAVLEEVAARVRVAPGVARTYSSLDVPDALLAGAHGRGTVVLLGLEPGAGSIEALIPPLRAAIAPIEAGLRGRHPEAALRLTGEAVLNFDLRRTGSAEVRGAERRTLPVTLALVLLAFGALAAALIPIAAGALAIMLALGAAVSLTAFGPLSLTLQSVVSMLGLGLGIDYALVTVSRFRESLAAGRDARGAAEDAARHAGHTVLVSGAAVAIGFLGLLLVPLGELRSVAAGGLLTVLVSVLLATTLLPGVLSWLGPRIDLGRVWSRRGSSASLVRWRRWGRFVARRPLRTLLVSGVPLAMLALQAARLHAELPRGDWLPPGMESSRGLRDLREMGRGGLVSALRIVIELPEDAPALSAAGLAASARLERALGADARIAHVRSLRSLAAERADDPRYVALLPYAAKRCFVSEEGDAALVEAVPREDAEPEQLARLVRELRAADASRLTGLPGARLLVGGLPGFNVDYEDAVAGRLPGVVAVVVSGTLLALALAFRSLLIPLKAVALNLFSVAAAFGAVVLAFQDGLGAGPLGLDGATGSVFRSVPILVFCIVFGLSMDYEVFLVARVAEARRGGLDADAALADGLAHTGGVITSAAAIMIAVFASFTLGGFLMTKMLGFALAAAVLIDATLVRIAIGPALLGLAGRYNWWPGEPLRGEVSRTPHAPPRLVTE